MKKTYTRKQILEAISYWEGVLKKMNESDMRLISLSYANIRSKVSSRVHTDGFVYGYTVDPINLGDAKLKILTGLVKFDKLPTFNQIMDKINDIAVREHGVKPYDFENDEFGGEVSTCDIFFGKDGNETPFIKVTANSDEIETFKDSDDFILFYYPDPNSVEFELWHNGEKCSNKEYA